MSIHGTQRLLVIEDDPVLGHHLASYLKHEGFEVSLCADGEQGLRLAQAYDFQLVILDILLPGRNGLDVLRELHREKGTPTIMMSALGEEHDRTTGFIYGADDYLTKPFSMAELAARVNALLRRVQLERRLAVAPAPGDAAGPLYFCGRRKDVRYQQHWLELTESEFRLLRLFWQYRGEVLDKHTLSTQAMNREYRAGDRGLDMHVSHLRRKLQLANFTAFELTTLRNQGYRFDKAVA